MIPSTFPRIPHLHGSHAAPDDLLLDDDESARFLARPVVVLEKLDGVNVTLRMRGGRVVFGLKDEWRSHARGGLQRALTVFVALHEPALARLLARGRTLYAEWIWHTVSVRYRDLPDVLVGIALRERDGRFLRFDAAAAAITRAGFATAEPVFTGRVRDLSAARALVGRSRYGARTMEGLIFEQRDVVSERRWAKWVDPSYRHPSGLAGGTNTVRRG